MLIHVFYALHWLHQNPHLHSIIRFTVFILTHTRTHIFIQICDWQAMFVSKMDAETRRLQMKKEKRNPWCSHLLHFFPSSLISFKSFYLSQPSFSAVCISVWVCERLPGAALSLSLKCYLANQLDIENSRWALSSTQSMTLIFPNQQIKILLSEGKIAHIYRCMQLHRAIIVFVYFLLKLTIKLQQITRRWKGSIIS